jgi:hypothetical protein
MDLKNQLSSDSDSDNDDNDDKVYDQNERKYVGEGTIGNDFGSKGILRHMNVYM